MFVIFGLLPCVSTLACVASVSVRFRSKERGTRTKDRAKNGASKRAGRGGEERFPSFPSPSFIFWLSFHFSRCQNRESPSLLFFCSETKRKRLLRRLLAHKPLVKHEIRTTCTRSINEPLSRETGLDLPVRALNKKKLRLRTAIPQYKAFLKRREPELGSCLSCEEIEKDVKNTKTKLIFLYSYTGLLVLVIRVVYTVEPPHKGHLGDRRKWPLKRGLNKSQ